MPSTTSETALDAALTAQLIVAWAGEAGDPPRLGWWRTDMASEYGGEDLFRRMLPNTWRWAALTAAREAARRTDVDSRREAHDADAFLSLFGLGADVDRRLDERLADLTRSGREPEIALSGLEPWLSKPFDRTAFAAWVAEHGVPATTQSPVGRRLRGAPPEDLDAAVRPLVAALAPLGPGYPLPHFKRAS
ncbi:MAG: BREX-6 system BrxE protein [Planctomycetes bacterium]|nr:BREX-6 system BrxE protein [Planctomycetota bacterium]MBM4057030.1 BREX-6 system BrxE protein [Planctomycetota bacterium]